MISFFFFCWRKTSARCPFHYKKWHVNYLKKSISLLFGPCSINEITAQPDWIKTQKNQTSPDLPAICWTKMRIEEGGKNRLSSWERIKCIRMKVRKALNVSCDPEIRWISMETAGGLEFFCAKSRNGITGGFLQIGGKILNLKKLTNMWDLHRGVSFFHCWHRSAARIRQDSTWWKCQQKHSTKF